MIIVQNTFSSFSTDDLAKAKEFYTKTLGLEEIDEEMGLMLALPGGARVFVYEKDDHVPATFTVLNFEVKDIDAVVKDLAASGITFEEYDWGEGGKTDEHGIMRGMADKQGPDIAWFKDPAGNFLAVLEN
jgi:catechol 2,3-dioxygenase-like lactoylglutathione lyase family enzyme